MRAARVNAAHMDLDEIPAGRPGDPLTLLSKQDLDPLSVEELKARIVALEAEIARVKKHADRAVNHRASAEELFKR
jgi:uncharacterized small protein (DUF1192 family)